MSDFPRATYVPKGWGAELWLHNGPEYCGKILIVHGGRRCSLHYHETKRETFYLRSGSVRMVTYMRGSSTPDREWCMVPGEVLELAPGIWHQFSGIAPISEIVEVSTEHIESDTVRIERGD